VRSVLRLVAAIAVMVVGCGPIAWLALSAFKRRVDLLDWSPSLFFTPTLANFEQAFGRDAFGWHIGNSFAIASASTFLAVALGLPAGFALSRCRVPASQAILFFALSARMAIPAALALPLFVVFRTLRLLDTIPGLVVAHTGVNLAFSVWMLKGFFDELPPSFTAAAIIDGLPTWTIFRLAARAIAPGASVVALFCFIFSWNEFFLSMVLSSRSATTLPIAILGLVTPAGTQWGEVAAIGASAIFPVILLAAVGRERLARALSFGAFKG
jgi:multiple sugar transport system permease protein